MKEKIRRERLLLKDIKELYELGKPQMRNLTRNLACFHIMAIAYAFIEIWVWDKTDLYLKRNRPCSYDFDRRPSYKANKSPCRSNSNGQIIGEIRQNDNPENIK